MYYDSVLNKQSLTSVSVDEQSIEQEDISDEKLKESETLKIEFTNIPTSLEKMIKNVSILEVGKKSTSKTFSDFSDITFLDDWNITSEEKVTKLLPDLKPLAYSSSEENDVSDTENKTCKCICNQLSGSSDKQLVGEKPNTEQNCPVHENEQTNEQHLREKEHCCAKNASRDSASVRDTASTELQSNEIQQQVLDVKECVCYLRNHPKEELDVKQQEEGTQTYILGLEQEAEAEDDQPSERVAVEDVYEENRLSKIVPNPRPMDKQEYNSILTAYIKVRAKKKEHIDDQDYPIPVYEQFARKEGIEKFYCDQGCYYVLEYEELNSDTIKCLAKTIIGDYSFPPKTSLEIFGEKYKEAMLHVGDQSIVKTGKEKEDKKKKKKGKADKNKATVEKQTEKSSKDKTTKKAKDKGGKKIKKEKGKNKDEVVIEHEDKEVQFPDEEEAQSEELHEPRAGESDWEYVNLLIPNIIELSLADLWDNFETNYRKNFKDLFFNKRVILDSIAPFLYQVRKTMEEFIARPDQKSNYLREFQKSLNELDLNLRNDEETKSELFCTIDEFKEKLLDVCDATMRESEEKRRDFIKQNWLFCQFCEMTQNSRIAFQLEIDRLVDTLQFLSDYYTAIITKSAKEGYEFHKEVLPKHEYDEQGSNNFNELFIDIQSENKEDTEFHKYIEESKNAASSFVESMQPLALKPVTDMKKLFQPQEKEKKPMKSKKGQIKKLELDEDVKENVDQIFEEWECAINGEFARMNLQLDVIKKEAFNRLNDSIAWIKKIFEAIFNNISARYENEISNIHKACELLTQSVVDEMIIQPELTFEGDQLAQIQITLFPDTLAIPAEDYKEGSFKIQQLENLVRILLDLAPSGFIVRNIFLLVIQDVLYQDDEQADTPKLWRNMSMRTLSALIKKLFDNEKYLYWKDFIVCNLMIPFPTREELMNVRKQFREYDNYLLEQVTREEFDSITFWFDQEENADRLKSIIFKMYQTDDDQFNYTAMLLDFCKDEDPVLGFVKALELSLGKFICCEAQLGKSFVEEILEARMLFEQQKKDHEDTISLAKKTVSLLIDKIIDSPEDEELSLTEVENYRISNSSIREKCRSMSAHSQPSEDKIILDYKFSLTKIGFESRDGTDRCYFLPLGLILVVVNTEVSWNSKIEDPTSQSFKDKIVQIYQECKNPNFNNVVLAHEFLNNEKLKEVFSTTNKFLAHNPVKIVKSILEDPPPSLKDQDEFLATVEALFSPSREAVQGWTKKCH